MGDTTTTTSTIMTGLMSTMTAMAGPQQTGGQNNGNGTGNGNGNGDGEGDGPTSRPLLFFVALGFGVVFTNLWIIVGVKYCFRYNQRARQAELARENGEPIDLANMHRPRRRKEKKLMSMEEVNERFPLVKYKIWRATREHEGLPTAGGITAPPSRAASIREAVRLSTDRRSFDGDTSSSSAQPPADAAQTDRPTDMIDFADSSQPRRSLDPARTSLQEKRDANVAPGEESQAGVATKTSGATAPPENLPTVEDEDEDDPIRTAVPAELLASPGDTCAICLDTLEDDDEVRGLTCGHAFHASCLDPWLTSRRACCPLCKTDFYIPKPRPEGEAANEEGTETTRRGRRGERRAGEDVAVPTNAWLTGRGGTFRPRIVLAGARFQLDHHDRYGFPILTRNRGERRDQRRNETDTTEDQEQPEQEQQQQQQQEQPTQQPSFGSRFMSGIRGIPGAMRRTPNATPGSENQTGSTEAEREQSQTTTQTTTTTDAQTTPGQLEAGTRFG